MSFTLNVIYREQLHRIQVSPKAQGLFRIVRTLTAQKFGIRNTDSISFSFLDDDNDEISVSSDVELADAIRLCRSKNNKSLVLTTHADEEDEAQQDISNLPICPICDHMVDDELEVHVNKCLEKQSVENDELIAKALAAQAASPVHEDEKKMRPQRQLAVSPKHSVAATIAGFPRNKNIKAIANRFNLQIDNVQLKDRDHFFFDWGTASSSNLTALVDAHAMPVIWPVLLRRRSTRVPLDSLRVMTGNQMGHGVLTSVPLLEVLCDLGLVCDTSFLSCSNVYAPQKDKNVEVQLQATMLPFNDNVSTPYDLCLRNHGSGESPADLVILATRDGTSAQLVQAHKPQKLLCNKHGKSACFVSKKNDLKPEVAIVIEVPLQWQERNPENNVSTRHCVVFVPAADGERWAEEKHDDNDDNGDNAFPILAGSFYRNESLPIRITVQFLFATRTGYASSSMFKTIASMYDNMLRTPEEIGRILLGSKKVFRRADGKLMSNDLHPDVICNNCRQPLVNGARYKCVSCPTFDLCAVCENLGYIHTHHLFLKIADSRKHMDDKRTWDNKTQHEHKCHYCLKAIKGVRLYCRICDENSCVGCEANSAHPLDHPLIMYRR